jgi:activator of HSP90 ATPase
VTDQPTVTPPPPPVDRATRMRQARFSPYTGPVTNISRRVNLAAPPSAVYRCLVDPAEHAALIGARAEPGAVPGDQVELAGGRFTGLLMEVLEDRHVVFALKPSAGEWPIHHYTTTTFMLRPEGEGTTLVLFVQAVPEERVDELAALWQQMYLDKLTGAFPIPATS